MFVDTSVKATEGFFTSVEPLSCVSVPVSELSFGVSSVGVVPPSEPVPVPSDGVASGVPASIPSVFVFV